MAALKCKICGGNVIPNGGEGVCDSCGTRVSLDDVSDERSIENRNRANDARVRQDYAAAQRAWTGIVSDEPGSAEAHWNLALSRYGIEYVWDDRAADFYPVMNLLRYEPFSDDPDYHAAMQCADENGIVYYMNEGTRIAKIQEHMLELIRNEKEYDVFLCCSTQTADTRYADGVYQALTEKGLRVFYEKQSLAGREGKEQEPYIFSALYTSRVMILLGTKAEDLTDTWVKNEWERFLQQMQEDKRKYLIPVYAHMRPEFFPKEIATREAVDLTASGAMMDLVRGVLRLTGKENTAGSYAEAARIRQQMEEKLKAKDYREVNRLGREALAIAPEDADVWYMLFLAENLCPDEFALLQKNINWYDSGTFAKTYELASRRRRVTLDRVKANWDAYQERLSTDKAYSQEEAARRKSVEKTAKKARDLMSVGEYGDAYRVLTNITATDETEALRADCELGMKYAEIDSHRYLEDRLKAEAPDTLQKFIKMSKPLRRTTTTGGLWHAMPVLIGALLMVIGNVVALFERDLSGKFLAVGLIILLYGVLTKWIDKTILRCFLAMFIAAGVISVYQDLGTGTYMYLILAAVFAVVAFLAYRDLGRQGKSLSVKCARYYNENLRPAENRLIAQYRAEFEPLEKYTPLNGLTTVWEIYMESGQE